MKRIAVFAGLAEGDFLPLEALGVVGIPQRGGDEHTPGRRSLPS